MLARTLAALAALSLAAAPVAAQPAPAADPAPEQAQGSTLRGEAVGYVLLPLLVLLVVLVAALKGDEEPHSP